MFEVKEKKSKREHRMGINLFLKSKYFRKQEGLSLIYFKGNNKVWGHTFFLKRRYSWKQKGMSPIQF